MLQLTQYAENKKRNKFILRDQQNDEEVTVHERSINMSKLEHKCDILLRNFAKGH